MEPDEHHAGPSKGVRIGIFGGTFDPPHLGHLIVAQDVAEALSLDRILWIPAGAPPHKRGGGPSPAAVRLEMTRAAVDGDGRFLVDDTEVRRPGPSFTVDTLGELKGRDPAAALHLVMGSDQFAAFDGWRRPEEIARLARIVVMTRDGEEASGPVPEVEHTVVSVTRVDVSSTDLRTRVREGRSIRHLVPEPVRRIIEDRGLYARGS